MSKETVAEVIKSCNIPCAHASFVRGSAPSLPWATFYVEGVDGFAADNVIYTQKTNWAIELVQRSSDTELEHALENAIVANFSPFDKSEYWDNNEHCLITTYYFIEIEEGN